MPNLNPQTAYVPVSIEERTPTEEGVYFVKPKTGDNEALYASGTGHHSRWKAIVEYWLEPRPDSFVFSREELEEFAKEMYLAGRSYQLNHKNAPRPDFPTLINKMFEK